MEKFSKIPLENRLERGDNITRDALEEYRPCLKKPRVLVVEDREDIQELYQKYLTTGFDLVIAGTIEIAEEIINRENENFDAIAIDGCVPGDKINTVPLLIKICQKYDCPKIAISSLMKYNLELMKNGCTHMCDKSGLSGVLLGIFSKKE